MIPLTGVPACHIISQLTESSISTFNKACCYVANNFLQSENFSSLSRWLSSCGDATLPVCYSSIIDNLPEDWLAQVHQPDPQWLSKYNRLRMFPWETSHISADTFLENKRGTLHSRSFLLPLDCRIKRSIQLIHKRHLATQPPRELLFYEEKARNSPNDAHAQYTYLKKVVKVDPGHAIRWYEKYQCSRLMDSSLDAVYREAVHSRAGGQAPPTPGFELHRNAGTQGKPLHVVMAEVKDDKGRRMSRFIGYLFLGLGGLYLLSKLASSISPSRMLGGKEYQPEQVNHAVRFDDVQGCDEAKNDLQEVVQFLQDPEKFERLGAKIPCGVLLVGPPGTGKTLLARAIAGEANVPFFFVSGSEFDEMFVGVGASRIRKLFQSAKEQAPSIIFIDELDAVGGKRSVNESSPYSRMTLNQLLVELDGFKENEGVIVVGATNFAEVLDTALTRPGRFDSRVHVTLPDVRGRVNILNLYINKTKCSDDVDPEVIARSTPGFTGADLSNLVNQAALRAASLQLSSVQMEHFDWARDKIIMGPERRSAVINKNDRKVTAYHESGHAIVAQYTKDANPPHKATIIPRGNALGYVMRLPKNDELSMTRKQLLAEMDVCMGGRVAEELIFGTDNITTGASSDMQQASSLARDMVTKYGMSAEVGTILIDERQDNVSPELQSLIESEVRRLVQESYQRAKHIITKYHKEHKLLAEGLLRYETLNENEILLVLKGKSL